MNYDEAVKRTWSVDKAPAQEEPERFKTLIHYATLAPSGHNTQCWRFRVEAGAIRLLPDLTRRTPVVDTDDHHLYVSLGCATENLCLAARAMGLSAEAEFHPQGDGEIRVTLMPGEAEPSPLFEAIERALAFILDANTRQLQNPAFRRELEAWIRFNDAEAVDKGDGLSGRATGNPQAPRWLGKYLMRAMRRPKAENAKVARQVRSSAGLGCSSRRWMTGRTGSRPAAATSASPCRPRRWAFATPSSTSRWRRRACAPRSPGRWGWPVGALTWWCASAMPRSLSRPVGSVMQQGEA